MRREYKQLVPHTDDCCPGHDRFPTETYKGRRSKRARARDKKVEHKYIRTLVRRIIFIEVNFGHII